MLKRLFLGLLFATLLLAAVVLARTASFRPMSYGEALLPGISVDAELAAEHLAGAIRFRTVTGQNAALVDSGAFLGLHQYLEAAYPATHAQLERETVSRLSLLYTWKGRDESMAPAILMGHLDVVPADDGPESAWRHPPFGGVVDGDYVWGRGSLDDKVGVIAILEAVEALLEGGFVPERTFYMAFGHDEEGGGMRGAAVMAELVARRSDKPPAFVLDEGGMIGRGLLPGLDDPVAFVGIAEKGYLSLELSAEGKGGHSSAPPARTAVGRVADAVSRLEGNPFPPRVDGAVEAMLRHIGPHMAPLQRAAIANMWLTRPVVAASMASGQRSAPAVRTTTAPTMLSAGVRENVLPQRATAVVNFRLLPGDTVDDVIERVKRVVDDDAVILEPINVYFNPSPVADASGAAFRLVARAASGSATTPEVVISPFLVPGATDSRYFAKYTDNVFRFTPVELTPEELSGFHGVDERVRIASLQSAAHYFAAIIRHSGDRLSDDAGSDAVE